MNKRAGFVTPVLDYFIVLAIVLVFIIFFALLALFSREIEFKLSGEVSQIDGFTALQNYLETEIEYEGHKMTFSEMIDRVEYAKARAIPYAPQRATPGSYERDLKPLTKTYLRKLEQATGCPMRIGIMVDSEKYEEVSGGGKASSECKKLKRYFDAQQTIPTVSGRKIVVYLKGGVK